MKRKLLFIILFSVISLTLTSCGRKENNSYTNTNINNELPIEEKNFKEQFGGTELICDDMKSGNIQYYNGSTVYIDNSLYKISPYGKVFSNDQQCIKSADDTIERYILPYSSSLPYLIINNKKGFYYFDGELHPKDDWKYDGYLINNYRDITILYDINFENIKNGTREYREWTYYNLRNDGNIYETIIQLDESDLSVRIKSDKIIYNNNEYGHISYFYYLKSDNIIFILSDKGLYTNEMIETDECIKYEDIECSYELVLNENYSKYRDKIKYIDCNYFIDFDNNIYYTSSLLK